MLCQSGQLSNTALPLAQAHAAAGPASEERALGSGSLGQARAGTHPHRRQASSGVQPPAQPACACHVP